MKQNSHSLRPLILLCYCCYIRKAPEARVKIEIQSTYDCQQSFHTETSSRPNLSLMLVKITCEYFYNPFSMVLKSVGKQQTSVGDGRSYSRRCVYCVVLFFLDLAENEWHLSFISLISTKSRLPWIVLVLFEATVILTHFLFPCMRTFQFRSNYPNRWGLSAHHPPKCFSHFWSSQSSFY